MIANSITSFNIAVCFDFFGCIRSGGGSDLHQSGRGLVTGGFFAGDQAKRATTAVSVGNKGAITRPSELLEAILVAGRKGLSISRYKGLGEMNAEQLWETTLDPNHRSLLRVEIDQADLADDIFTKLMGEVVEPRRDFIVENALNVANLDV